MTRRGVLALAVVTAGLAGVVGLELIHGTRDVGAMNFSPPASRSTMTAPAAAPGPTDRTRDWVRTVLARPLFAPDRRPMAGPAAVSTRLPRVAGILVNGGSRSVIFAAADGGKPLVVGVGADVAGFRVQSIDVGQVTVVGPDGPRVLRPSFDPAPPAAVRAPPGLPGLAGFGVPAGPAAR